MKIRSVAITAMTSVVLLVAVPALSSPAMAGTTAGPARSGTSTASAARSASSCRPGTPSIAAPTTVFYDSAQPAFGPRVLPTAAPVGQLLPFYQRFGLLTEAQFAAKYRSGTSWIYPPDDGFLTIAGTPVEYARTLNPGSEIDRFGYSGGAYLSPAHTLFTQRALPPQNLTTPAQTPLSNYHLYCVLRAFPVEAGPIAPWFEQIGLGIQYKLDTTLLPQAGTALSVTWLLGNGYLVEENPAA